MVEISPLRHRMIEDMMVRNLSPATQRSYVHAVAKFACFFGRSPEKLDLEDVPAFQVHLVAGGMSWPALSQTICALRFFYGVTLSQADLPERIAYAREPQKLPVMLSAEEVVRFLEAVPSLKCRAALTTAYATGLRASEVASLKVADIDSSRMVVRIEQGKGGRDRYVMPSALLKTVRWPRSLSGRKGAPGFLPTPGGSNEGLGEGAAGGPPTSYTTPVARGLCARSRLQADTTQTQRIANDRHRT
jgi:integrase/recombinase XerD